MSLLLNQWIFCRKPSPKNTPATALIQLESLFIDGIQHSIPRCQLIFCPNPIPKNLQYLKRGRGVFLKFHIFALVVGAFYKRSKPVCDESALFIDRGGQYRVQLYRGTVPWYFFRTGTGTAVLFKICTVFLYRGTFFTFYPELCGTLLAI